MKRPLLFRPEPVLTEPPDYHLCAIFERQPGGVVPGPSATSDIELNRVERVHSPRSLEVPLVTNLGV